MVLGTHGGDAATWGPCWVLGSGPRTQTEPSPPGRTLDSGRALPTLHGPKPVRSTPGAPYGAGAGASTPPASPPAATHGHPPRRRCHRCPGRWETPSAAGAAPRPSECPAGWVPRTPSAGEAGAVLRGAVVTGPWDSPPSVCPASSETEDSSHLYHSNSFARPSGKSIYNQRKDYSQSLLKPQSNFQHHVEHLLTMRLDRDIRSTEDCLARLKALEAQGRVWGQDLILHVKNQELVLSDVESKEELESYPLGSVRDCAVLLDACSYDSVLAVSVQEQAPPGTSVLLFQCDRIGFLSAQGITHQHLENPDAPQLLHIIFDTLSFVLDNSPNPRLAPAVEAPLLIPEAVELLEKTLHPHEYSTWKMLGIAWNKTRAEYPHSEQVPPYIPTFSDGWLPPPMLKPEQQQQLPATGHKNAPSYGNFPGHRNGDVPGHGSAPRRGDIPGQVPFSPPPRLARAVYEFQGRNPQELSVRMGDTLEVLDQQKKWWLVQSSLGHKGYVPSNILEPLGHEDSRSQVSPPNLHMGSSPAEVTAWLKDKGFSRITVRCLGVLSGHQLLQMTPEELRAVCPEEWRRVLFKLSSVKTSLGMSPRD
nr:epidermal growth factor receptor kinase substrate 8-like protein 3 [Anser cygnoides]